MAAARKPKATGPDQAPSPPDEAPQEAPVAPEAPSEPREAPTTPDTTQEAVRRRYRADRAMGRLRRGEVFEADDTHPAVRSGYVTLVEDQDVPAEVAAALDS